MEKERRDEFLEKKKHGSMLFPFNIYPCTIPKDFPAVALHWQKSMELIFVKKGKGQVQLGLEVTEAQGGDIFVVPPGTLHALRAVPGGYAMEYENIIFDVEFLGGGGADVCAQEYLVPLASGQLLCPLLLRADSEGYGELARCLGDAEELCEAREKGYELGVKAAMLRLLFLLYRRCPDGPRADSPDTERLKAVLRRVEQEYSQRLTVSEMAEGCSCSSSHFMRWFKQRTGTSFTAYLNERRLAAAAEALRGTDDKVVVIAENVGFENLSNFNRQFRARYGMTPREYRME